MKSVSVSVADARCLAELALALFELADDGVADHLPKQRFLVREVEVDGALGEPGALGDILEPRAREAALAEYLERGREDLAGRSSGNRRHLGSADVERPSLQPLEKAILADDVSR